MSIRHGVAAACVIASATVLSGIFSAAATGLAPRQPATSAAAAARGAEAQLASEVAVSAVRRCPAAVWLWSVDTQDWMADGSGAAYWVNRIIRLAEREGGALRHPVVLMHNQPIGNPATVAALPVIIRFFRAHGYRFVKL
jgi:peptidoglycan/xylan/chitin deacetylase (PgdA/CDA1 family)